VSALDHRLKEEVLRALSAYRQTGRMLVSHAGPKCTMEERKLLSGFSLLLVHMNDLHQYRPKELGNTRWMV